MQIKEICNNYNGERECWNEITEKSDGHSKPSEITITQTQTESYPPQDHTIPTKGNQCRMGKAVIESVSQSVSDNVNQPLGWIGYVMVREEEENRFDLFVIGLQGVINRPELKQHLR